MGLRSRLVRVLLSDGSGLTARQAATQLGDARHEVHVLSSDPLCLARFTRRVSQVWRTPPYGDDPLAWLEAAIEAYQKGRFQVLFPTQEQVAVLAACPERLAEAGVHTAVPSFEALRMVQDKVSAFATLGRFGLPQPAGAVLSSPREIEDWDRFPVYLKTPIGTATSGVRLARDFQELADAVTNAAAGGAFEQGGLLAQEPAEGPLAMVQGIFCEGELVAFHANLRVREGTSGGASHKRSIALPAVEDHLSVLGRQLEWHGALSADVIVTRSAPVFIDINPRLVEPGNARRAGVDLVQPMLDLAIGHRPTKQELGRPEVSTHQLLLALLGAAQRDGRRRGVVREILDALRHRGDYLNSAEELTPISRDWRAAVPIAAATATTLVNPNLAYTFSSGAVRNYALTQVGWQQLLDIQR